MSATRPRGPLQAGEAVILLDRKNREYLVRLDPFRPIAVRGGRIGVEEIVGREEGSVVRSSLNEPFLVFRPTLAQLIPDLPRAAQVIYPKDIGPILVWGDIFPGARVVEAGVGAGGLTIALLRALGSQGELFSYEIREDFAALARKNVERYFGPAPNWVLTVGDVADKLAVADADRVVLDLPEPWRVIEAAANALRPGGILLCYLPTVLQFKELIDRLRENRGFARIETSETLMRFWHVEGASVRPQHRMVAHTGFLVSARRVSG
ncbi:MAG TPA: tRNA (adenine-N1)-methyltransferase [candidate division Zixibacteria bacterium]|nr:tRNA (adenine-N1)-methyltransferase [candidate division Zixibacteria bacterium]